MDAAERAARESYGRLISSLSSRWHDIGAAEDALSEAFLAALRQWPVDGVPRNPEGWLLTTSRRRLVDASRRSRVRRDAEEDLVLLGAERPESSPWPDERLGLLFVCAHPAIEAGVCTPLMLQTVLGLDAARIAGAMCVAPKTLGQRLWRAKVKIRDAGVPFEVPEASELSGRLPPVLEAIYAAFGTGWEDVTAGDAPRTGLAAEAIWLGQVLVERLPDEPEARGLLALMSYADARRTARRDTQGRFVPLSAQDPTAWSPERIAEGEAHLRAAARFGRPGPYQLEAAIQSAHVDARRTGVANATLIARLYTMLVHVAPTLGARVAHAAAVGVAEGPEQGLGCLDALGPVGDHQPYWAVRAHLLREAHRPDLADRALARAVGLTSDPAIRQWLLSRPG